MHVLRTFFISFGLFIFGVLDVWGAVPLVTVASPAQDLTKWCGKLSRELKSVHYERCIKHSWRFESTSTKGNPIPYLYWGKSPDVVAASPSPEHRRILILGALHGDEISAVSTVFRWIDFLERTKADSFLRENTYLIFPLANPDGFYARPRTRMNSAGVDLNRNFSTKEWNEKAILFWKKKAAADPRRFPGVKAASELETQVVQKAVNEFKPDLIISVHAPYKLVDHDGPISFPSTESPLPVRTLGAYPGSLGTYAGIERNIAVVTPELPNARQLPEGNAVEQLLLFIMRAKF